MELLKGDIINAAFSELRISGLTVNAAPEDNKLALRKLEALAHEYMARNINLNYFFEDEPDAGSPSGILPQYENAFSICLAERMLTDFGKGMQPDPTLMKSYSAAIGFLTTITTTINEVLPSSRMPRGSGSYRGFARYTHFNRHREQAPNSAATETMYIGDITDFEENFQNILSTGEDISSYTITSDDGLNIVSDSLESPLVKFRIEALSQQTTTTGTNRTYQRIKIVVDTSDGNRRTRFVNFNVLEVS